MSRVSRQNKAIEQIYQRIKEVLTNARSRAWQAVNTAIAFPILHSLRGELIWTHYRPRYKLYLPTEKELAAELIKEQTAIEMERKLQGE